MKQPQLFTGLTLSRFCLQTSMLLKSATPLSEGFLLMAKNSKNQSHANTLHIMAEQIKQGTPFSQAMKESSCFPSYVVHMTLLGEQTGTLDVTMERLSEYYEQEYYTKENLRRAITSPAIMLFMLMTILFVLFTKVMPLFSDVYKELGATVPKVAVVAIKVGGILSGFALILSLFLLLLFLFLWLYSRKQKENSLFHRFLSLIEKHSSISTMIALHRFCSVMATAYPCGVDLVSACMLAKSVVSNPDIQDKIEQCAYELEHGKNFSEAVKRAELFVDFDLQLIQTGTKTGQLEPTLSHLDEEYNRRTYDSIQNLISRLEPTIVLVLALSTGLILLSVMLPLIGVLSSIG